MFHTIGIVFREGYRWQRALWGLSALAVAGCGSKAQETYPTSGIVQWSDGKPAIELAGGTVALQVIEGPAIRVSPHGQIQSDGTFVVHTYESGDGAPVGRYRISVRPNWSREDEKPRPPPVMDPRFQSYQTSGLEAQIKPAPANELQLIVEWASKR
jgi:hypothetical protein